MPEPLTRKFDASKETHDLCRQMSKTGAFLSVNGHHAVAAALFNAISEIDKAMDAQCIVGLSKLLD